MKRPGLAAVRIRSQNSGRDSAEGALGVLPVLPGIKGTATARFQRTGVSYAR